MKTYKKIFGTEDPQEALLRWKFDFKGFAENVIGLQIKWFHKEWVDLLESKKRTAIFAATGIGKTEVLGIAYPLWKLWYAPKTEFLIVSTSLPQAKGVLDRIKMQILNNELLRELVPNIREQTWSTTEITTVNQGKILCRPLNVNVKSYHVDYVLCDEADSYEKKEHDVFFKYVITRAGSKKGNVCCISTPESEQGLMSDKLQSNEEWYVKYYPIMNEKEEPIWPEKFPLAWIKQKRRELGPRAFTLQYMCDIKIPADAMDNPFPLSLLLDNSDKKLAFEKKYGDGIYYAFYDPAFSPRGDFNAIVIGKKVEDNIIQIVKIYRFKGSYQEALPILIAAKKLYNYVKLGVDTSSGGRMVLPELAKYGLPCVGYNFTPGNRNEAFKVTSNKMTAHEIIIPIKPEGDTKIMTDVLFHELTHIELAETPSGLSTYKSKTKNDDVAMAFLMLIKVMCEEQPFLTYLKVSKRRDKERIKNYQKLPNRRFNFVEKGLA